MKKELNAWDVVDAIWDFLNTGRTSEIKGMTWNEAVKYIMKTDNISHYSIEEGVKKWLYETNYYKGKPNRSTMRWLYGEHVLLYDIWGCEKHMFTLETSDDYEKHIEGQTVACPMCNKDIMRPEKFTEYLNMGNLHGEIEWKQVMKRSKFHKAYIRKENFKYAIRHLFDEGYLTYKIKQFFSKLIKGFGS